MRVFGIERGDTKTVDELARQSRLASGGPTGVAVVCFCSISLASASSEGVEEEEEGGGEWLDMPEKFSRSSRLVNSALRGGA